MKGKADYVLGRVKTAYKKLSQRVDGATGRRYSRGNIAAALCRQFGFHRSTAYRYLALIEQGSESPSASDQLGRVSGQSKPQAGRKA
jgi:hypothetical protein